MSRERQVAKHLPPTREQERAKLAADRVKSITYLLPPCSTPGERSLHERETYELRLSWDPIKQGYIPAGSHQAHTFLDSSHQHERPHHGQQTEVPYSYLQPSHQETERPYQEGQYPTPHQAGTQEEEDWDKEIKSSWHRQPQYSWEVPLENPYGSDQAQSRWDTPWEDLYGDIPTESLYEDTPTRSPTTWERSMGDAPRDVKVYENQRQDRSYMSVCLHLYRSSKRSTSRARGCPYSQRGTYKASPGRGTYRNSRTVQNTQSWIKPQPQAKPHSSTSHGRRSSGSLALMPSVPKPQTEDPPTEPPPHLRDRDNIRVQVVPRPSSSIADDASCLQWSCPPRGPVRGHRSPQHTASRSRVYPVMQPAHSKEC